VLQGEAGYLGLLGSENVIGGVGHGASHALGCRMLAQTALPISPQSDLEVRGG
jgi:hypothetical protein